jgi:hypothetical protein
MKKTLLFLTGLLGIIIVSNAQCSENKTSRFSSSKTEYLNESNAVENSRDEKTTVDFKNKDIIILISGESEQKMTGSIKSATCDWSTPYKVGKSVYKATIVDEGGDVKNATITIEGKDSKLTFVVEVEEMPGKKIRLVADKYEEIS